MGLVVDILGFVAPAILIARVIPQAWRSFKQKNSHGISKWMLTLWFVGEALMIGYVMLKIGFDAPLICYYGGTMVGVTVMLRYKLWPKDKHFYWPKSVEKRYKNPLE